MSSVRLSVCRLFCRSTLLKSIQDMPYGISPRLMKVQVNLEGGHTATLLSCYAPTLAAPQEEKEEFYEQLERAIDAVPLKQKLFVLGDFNARVGRNHELWHKVLGRHGIGNENANGSMLLDLCTKQRLVITNTVFQQANKLKASWMHLRSKHWHLIDYVLVKQRDLRDIRLTRVMRATTIQSGLITEWSAPQCFSNPSQRNVSTEQHPPRSSLLLS